MLTGPALLANILAHPEDDLPRLVYSDYLEETGEEERAEFIRVQVELANLKPHVCHWTTRSDLFMREKGFGASNCCEEGRKVLPRELELRRREAALLDMQDADGIPARSHWFGPLRGLVQDWSYRRGFITAVTCTAADWLAHADALTAVTPLEEVRLTGPIATVFHHGSIRRVGVRGRRQWTYDELASVVGFSGKAEIVFSESPTSREGQLILLAAEWPRIHFDLPAAEHGRGPWDSDFVPPYPYERDSRGRFVRRIPLQERARR